jgi:hypothetical protein
MLTRLLRPFFGSSAFGGSGASSSFAVDLGLTIDRRCDSDLLPSSVDSAGSAGSAGSATFSDVERYDMRAMNWQKSVNSRSEMAPSSSESKTSAKRTQWSMVRAHELKPRTFSTTG